MEREVGTQLKITIMKEGETARIKESEEGWIYMIQCLIERQVQMADDSL